MGNVDANVIAPALASIIKGGVLYINSGREPAQFEAQSEVEVFSDDDWNGGTAATALIAKQNTCLAKTSISGKRFAWPSAGFSTYILHFPAGRIPQPGIVLWDKDMMSGETKVVVTGCITYLAFKRIHHTAFCYFYDASISDPSHLNICNAGNDVN